MHTMPAIGVGGVMSPKSGDANAVYLNPQHPMHYLSNTTLAAVHSLARHVVAVAVCRLVLPRENGADPRKLFPILLKSADHNLFKNSDGLNKAEMNL